MEIEKERGNMYIAVLCTVMYCTDVYGTVCAFLRRWG